jgi:hypothetical protein
VILSATSDENGYDVKTEKEILCTIQEINDVVIIRI